MSLPPELFMTDMIGYWRADNFASNTLSDISGNGHNLACTNVTTTTTGGAGHGWAAGSVPLLLFEAVGAGSKAVSSDDSIWTRFHNGSGASFWTIFRASGTGLLSNGTEAFSGTGAVVSNEFGFEVWLDTTRNRLGIEFVNGEGSGYLIDNVNGHWYTWNDSFEVGTPHILICNISDTETPNIQFFLDGLPFASLSKGDREKDSPGTERPWGASAPSRHFTIGTTPNGANYFDGEIGEYGACSGVINAANRALLEAWAADNYGVVLKKTKRGIVLWDGNSLVDNFWRADQFPEISTTTLRQPVRNIMRAIAGLESNQMITRSEKHVTPCLDPEAPFNILFAWELVNDVANGWTKEEAYNHFTTYCQARMAEGWLVVASTMLPHRFTTEADYDWLRDTLVANQNDFCDALARPDLDPILGDWDAMVSDYGGGSGPKVYRSDGVHHTALGNQILAPYISTAINSLLRGRVLRRAA